MTKHSSLTRTCTACRIEKPLSAFLYLTSELGTAYGNICATCRGKGIKEKPKKMVHEDERSSTTSGMRIGVKQVVEIELQKKRDQKERLTSQEEAAKKREHVSNEKIDSVEKKEKAEKSHREAYINYKSKKQLLSTQSVIDRKRDERFKGSPLMEEKQRTVEATKLTEARKEEEKKTTVDLSSGAAHGFHTNREATIKRLQTLLGTGAPIMSQLYKTPPTEQEKANKETPRELVERKWPSPRKS